MKVDLGQAAWRKSSYSAQTGACVEVAAWRKSSYSGQAQDCVEVAGSLPGAVAVRDSKNPDGLTLVLAPAAWQVLARRVMDGELA